MSKNWKKAARKAVANLLQYLLQLFSENNFDVEKTKQALKQDFKEKVKKDFGIDLEKVIEKMSEENQELIASGFYGAIEHASPFDYGEEELVAGTIDADILPGLAKNFWNYKIEYNQREVHKNSCTSESGNIILSNTFGVEMDLETRKAKWDFFVSLGADPSYGRYTSKATDADRNFWNSSEKFGKQHGEVATFAIRTNSEMFWKLYKKGYMFKFGYRGNALYNKDREDGILDEILSGQFGDLTYGHAVSGCQDRAKETKELDLSIIDNYKGVVINQYKVKEFKKTRANLFFATSYFFIPKAHLDMEKVEEKAEEKTTDIIAKELGLWNGLNGENPLTRREGAYMMGRLSKKIYDGSFSSEMEKILQK